LEEKREDASLMLGEFLFRAISVFRKYSLESKKGDQNVHKKSGRGCVKELKKNVVVCMRAGRGERPRKDIDRTKEFGSRRGRKKQGAAKERHGRRSGEVGGE